MKEKGILDLTATQVELSTGTEMGSEILSHSIDRFGCTRSIVVDKNDDVICGKKVLKAAIKAGIKKVRFIETTGDELVVVKRVDVDANSRKGYEISLVDNLCSQEGLNWDIENLKKVMNTYFGFDPRFWSSSISWLEELEINDFFTELEAEKKQTQRVKTVEIVNQTSLFDYLEEEEGETE